MWLARVRSRTSGTGDLVIFRRRPQQVNGSWYPAGKEYGGWSALTWWTHQCEWPDPYPELDMSDSPICVNVLIEEMEES